MYWVVARIDELESEDVQLTSYSADGEELPAGWVPMEWYTECPGDCLRMPSAFPEVTPPPRGNRELGLFIIVRRVP